jgi:hypothetical protein
MQSSRYSRRILMKRQFSGQICEKKKYSSIRSYDNPSKSSLYVPCEKTDNHDESNSPSSQFCEKRPTMCT